MKKHSIKSCNIYGMVAPSLLAICSFCSINVIAEEITIIAIGNSITLSKPNRSIGWDGNWGMAATSIGNDYVSIFAKKVAADQKWHIRRENIIEFERAPIGDKARLSKYQLSEKAEYLIIELGDNVKSDTNSLLMFSSNYTNILKASTANKNRVICLSTWWGRKEINNVIKSACAQTKGIYIDISDLILNKDNSWVEKRKFIHPGVAQHPSDQGMEAIANRIFNAL